MITPNITSYSLNNVQSRNMTKLAFKAENKEAENKKDEVQSFKDDLKKEGIELPTLTPAQSGLAVGLFWFGAGFGIDRLVGKIVKSFKTPIKLSLGINAALGLAFGLQAYFKEKKNSPKHINKIS